MSKCTAFWWLRLVLTISYGNWQLWHLSILSELKALNHTASRFMGFFSVISNEPRLHTKKNNIHTKTTQIAYAMNKNMWVCIFDV